MPPTLGAVDDVELVVGDHVLLLRGNVVEVFHPSGSHVAIHVLHVAVEAKPRRDGDLEVKIGRQVSGMVLPDATVRVPSSGQGEVTAFFQEASRRRDLLRR
jgi:hypothetical protein